MEGVSNWFERKWDWLKNDSADWFKGGGYNWLIAAPVGIFAAMATMNAASSWVGGGTFSMLVSIPIAMTVGMVAATYAPKAFHGIKDWMMDSVPETGQQRTASVQQPTQQVQHARAHQGTIAPAYVADQADIGQLPPPPGSRPADNAVQIG